MNTRQTTSNTIQGKGEIPIRVYMKENEVVPENNNNTSNFIHPTAIVHPSVVMGAGNYFGPYCIIGSNVKIGSNNRFEAFCSIGLPPEHTSYWNGEYKGVEIKDNCVIREYVTVNSGTVQNTEIGHSCNLLRGAYVGHDSTLESNVTLSSNVLIPGHCYLFRGCNLGLGAILHQFSVIGHYTMIGMGTVITKKSIIEPGMTYIGTPARVLKQNTIGLMRNNISSEMLSTLRTEFFNRRNVQVKKVA